ncbi:MAG: FtsX-like permease family protein [Solirubrobacteraceae bacterium]|nr:FtsX-like permease family protein [Solirubrobacteraceae bacterium]
MTRVALRSLLTRRLRLLLTLLSVALGVSLISATYVFTDTINRSFDRIFAEGQKGVDAAVTPRELVDLGDSGGSRPTVSPDMLLRVRANPDVQVAEGAVFDTVTILGPDGKRVGVGGAPSFLGSLAQNRRFEASKIVAGRFPRTDDEVAVDNATFKKEGLRIGGRLTVQGAVARKDYVVVGTTQLGGVDSFGGTAVAGVLLDEALRMLGKTGYDAINAAARPGVSDAQLAQSLREQLPDSVVVRTGQAEAERQSRDVTSSLGFLTTFLLVFGFVAIFVGAFIIFNSFSITVAQRTRELGLLRALGATRRQVLFDVLGEGLLIGLVGSLAGLGLGLALAPGLRALFKGVGVDLPSTGLVVGSRTIVVALLVGILVAVFSAVVPALRATRVAPMAALQVGQTSGTGRISRRVTISACVLLAAGVALLAVGLFTSGSTNSRLALLGSGTLVTFLSVALLSPRLVRPLAGILGRPVQMIARFPGRLARENAIRQPSRTAATSAALMVGVALVTFASVFAAGTRALIDNGVKSDFTGSFVIRSGDGFSPFAAETMPAIAAVPGVGAVSGVRFSRARAVELGRTVDVSGIDPRSLPELYRVTIEQGPRDAVSGLGSGSGALVNKRFAEDRGIAVGDPLTLRTPTRATVRTRVVAIVKDNGGLIADVTVPNALLERSFGESKVAVGFVGLRPGAGEGATQKRIAELLSARFPAAEVETAQEFIDRQTGQVNQLLGLIYALLALSIVIAGFGIVNALVLSISERTREIGMLRAVGTTRRQIRSIIRWEAVITGLIGGIVGCALGLGLSVLFTQPLEDFTIVVPIGLLALLVVLAGVVGVIAAAWPARRAARLDVLEALAHE